VQQAPHPPDGVLSVAETIFRKRNCRFESKQSRSRVSDGYQKKIEALEQKLQRKNEVLSELLEEHTRLKKELGES